MTTGQDTATHLGDYLPADVWEHGMDGPEPGIRVSKSFDRPGQPILQIRLNGRVFNARITEETLADLHRQAAVRVG